MVNPRKKKSTENTQTERKTASTFQKDISLHTPKQSPTEKKHKKRMKIRSESAEAMDPFFNQIQEIVTLNFNPNMEVDNPDERPALPINTRITTMTNLYVIVKKLGAGGFGDVYEVHRERDNGVLALKTEFNVGDDMLQRLKREVLVYEVISVARRENPRSAEHILHMVDKGYNQYFKYIIMPYTGKSLDFIKDHIVKGEFASHTAIQISIQTHRALKNLHELGYVHRDVKPENFVVGKFIGTPKYAARATHQGKVVNRKEDMESWYYMVIELFGTEYLPWSNVESLDIMYYMKECLFKHKYDETVFHETAVPKNLIKIMREIDKVDGANRPNYEEHEKILEKLVNDHKIDFYAPFEWAEDMAKYYFKKEQKEEELKNEKKVRVRKSRTKK